MNNGDVPARKGAWRAVFALGCFVFIQLVGARRARAESARNVEGFEVLGTLGYGASSEPYYEGKKFEPYSLMLGLDLGYTLRFGLRIGADVDYGFGHKVEQTSSTGEEEVTDASSLALGGSLGYDFLWSSFRLRGAVDMGVIRYWLDSGRFERGSVPGASIYIGPKVALIWRYRDLELGLQTKYWATSADGPGHMSVVQVGLMGGVRF